MGRSTNNLFKLTLVTRARAEWYAFDICCTINTPEEITEVAHNPFSYFISKFMLFLRCRVLYIVTWNFVIYEVKTPLLNKLHHFIDVIT